MKKNAQSEGVSQKCMPTDVLMSMANTEQEDMLQRIGHVTRALHDSIRALGLDKMLEQVAHEIPDARDRLNYVAKMTEQAAERVLNAVDRSDTATIGAGHRSNSPQSTMASHYGKAITQVRIQSGQVQETLAYLALTDKNTVDTKALLMEIMMAQDFQDLTGQVIKKITVLAQDLERQLLQVLVDFSPATKKEDNSLLNGPQIDPHNTVDVVASQEQVDDLLDSLGILVFSYSSNPL